MITHLAAYPRLVSGGARLLFLRDAERKSFWMDHTFMHPNAMFMFEGGGRVCHRGQESRMAAPFVLLARPGEHYRYGPDTAWLEQGYVFAGTAWPADLPAFPDAPWPIRAPDYVLELLGLIARLAKNPAIPGVADQLDHLARMVVLASFHGIGEDLAEGPERRLYAAEHWMRTHFTEPFEMADVARRFGFSHPTFRRLWRAHFPVSPWQYVTDLRIQEADRLLQSRPDLSVGEVGYACGFRDRRHFATVFRRRRGKPPRLSRGG